MVRHEELAVMMHVAAIVVIALLAGAPARHPHFEKKIEAKIPTPEGTSVTVSVTHVTAPCNRKAFEAVKPGGTWHLANAHLQVSGPVVVGGQKFAAGSYRIVARKVDATAWELVLDAPGRFDAKLGEKATAVKTAFRSDAPKIEHLRLDVHPFGDRPEATSDIVVNFDVFEARVAIVVPK